MGEQDTYLLDSVDLLDDFNVPQRAHVVVQEGIENEGIVLVRGGRMMQESEFLEYQIVEKLRGVGLGC